MKRLLSMLLSAVMIISMFSVLGVVAAAQDENTTQTDIELLPEGGDITEGDNTTEGDETTEGDHIIGGDGTTDGAITDGEEGETIPEPDEDLSSIQFIPADEEDYQTYLYSNGGWDYIYDEATESYGFKYNYWMLGDIYLEGNTIILTDAEGNSQEYICTEDYDFVNENGEILDYEYLCCEVADINGLPNLIVTYGELSCEYPLTVIESEIEKIESITAEPILLSAYRDGMYGRLLSGENEGEISFFYDTIYNESFGFCITYKDGTQRTVSVDDDGDLVYEDTQEMFDIFEMSEKDSQVYEEWLPGNVYCVEYFYEGINFSVEFKVSENNVISIDYIQSGESKDLVYGVDGIYEYCEHESCADDMNLYFNFDQTRVFPADGDKITVTYSDDTSEVYKWENGRLYNENKENFNRIICLYDDQDENHWTIGENSFTVRFFGYEDTVKVNVSDREIEFIDVSSLEPVTVYENTNGVWDEDEEGNELYIYEYLIYSEGVYITISYIDGSYDTYTYSEETGWFEDEYGRYFPLDIYTSDNQYEEPWGIGEHEITVELGDYTTTFTVAVTENPVESIDFIIANTPVFKFEDEEYGFWFDFEDDGEEVFVYYSEEYYPYSAGNGIVVTFTDGTVIAYTYSEELDDFVDSNGNALLEGYYITFTDYQDELNWTPDSDDNYIVAEFMGARDYIPVVIDNGEKPVAAEITGVENVLTGVQLNWEKVNNAEEYLVYRRLEKANGKASNNPWVYVGSTNELTFVDDVELQDGAYYKYHIHTRNSNGKSAYNGATTATNRYIATVKNFKVSNTKTGVLFNWTRVGGYKIRLFRLEKGADKWVYLGEKNSDATNVYNVNAVSGKTYMYAAAYYVDGVASAIVYSDYITYLAEPHLKSIKNAVTGIYFNWTKVEGAVGYRVYRRAAGEKYFTYLGTTTNLWYCDNAVRNNNGTYYKYTVKAIAADGSMSSYEGGLLLRRLVIPYIQSLTNNTNGITVKWAEIPGATSYRVYRRGAGQTTWTYLASVTGLSYTDTGVKNSSGSYYRYTVKAVVNGAFTGYNPDGPYTMRLSTPTLKSATRLDEGVKVTWNGVKGAQGYQVYRKTADTTWVLIDTVSGTSYVDDSAFPGVEYTYTVRAYKGNYRSSYIPVGVTA